MSIERPNLAGAFAPRPKAEPVDRSASLKGMLNQPRPVRAVPPAPAEPAAVESEAPLDHVDEVAAAEPAAVPTSATKPRTSTRGSGRAKAPAFAADEIGNVACYLEPEVHATARNEIRQQGITYDQLLVEAFNHITDDQLRDLFQPKAAERAASGMPVRARRARGMSGIQVQFRMDGQQKAWLDDKVLQVAAPSRSALVATTLRLYLHAAG